MGTGNSLTISGEYTKETKYRCISRNTVRPQPVYKKDKIVLDKNTAFDNNIQKPHKVLMVLLDFMKVILNFIFGIFVGALVGQ